MDLLTAAPAARLPTPPPAADTSKAKVNTHLKFLERESKPIKDVKKGPVSVHVLGQANKLLAPKAEAGAKRVREQWLKGRQQARPAKGKKLTEGRLERREFGKAGFLRN